MTVVNCANDDIGDGHHARVKIYQNKKKKKKLMKNKNKKIEIKLLLNEKNKRNKK